MLWNLPHPLTRLSLLNKRKRAGLHLALPNCGIFFWQRTKKLWIVVIAPSTHLPGAGQLACEYVPCGLFFLAPFVAHLQYIPSWVNWGHAWGVGCGVDGFSMLLLLLASHR